MISTSNPFAPVPNEVYGFAEGASSARESAMRFQQAGDAKQNELNNMLGGFNRRTRLTKRRRWYKKGGQGAPAPGTKIEVPSFEQVGPAIGPVGGNQLSAMTNQLKLDQQVASCNDCYATGTCGLTSGCPQSGGSKHHKKHTNKHKTHKSVSRKHPYAISAKRVKLSPFKSVSSVKKTLKAYKKGRKIGFTQKSSLRSMGLIPRSNGKFVLGSKY